MDTSWASICFKLGVLLTLTFQCTESFRTNLQSPHMKISIMAGNPFTLDPKNNPEQTNPTLRQYNMNQASHHSAHTGHSKTSNTKKYGPPSPYSSHQKQRQPSPYSQSPNFKNVPGQNGNSKVGTPNQYGLNPQYGTNNNRNTYNKEHKQQYSSKPYQQHYDEDDSYNKPNYNPNKEHVPGNDYSNNRYIEGSFQEHGNSENAPGYQQNGHVSYQNQDNDSPNKERDIIYSQPYDDDSQEYDLNNNHNQHDDDVSIVYENDKDANQYGGIANNGAGKGYGNSDYHQNQKDQDSNQGYYNQNYPHQSNHGSDQGTGSNYDQKPQNYGGHKQNANKDNQHAYSPNQGYANNKKKHTSTYGGSQNYENDDTSAHEHGNNHNQNKYAYSANHGHNKNNPNHGNYPPNSGYGKKPIGEGYGHSGQGNSHMQHHSGPVSHDTAQGHSPTPYKSHGTKPQYGPNYGNIQSHSSGNNNHKNTKSQYQIVDINDDPNTLKANTKSTLNLYNQAHLNQLNIPSSFSMGYSSPELNQLLNQQMYMHQPVLHGNGFILPGFHG